MLCVATMKNLIFKVLVIGEKLFKEERKDWLVRQILKTNIRCLVKLGALNARFKSYPN